MLTNYLGGQYFLTVDEIQVDEKNVYLIESKHSKSSFLPSKSDIKDGLLKMILYTNLKNTEVNEISKNAIPVLKLTSSKLQKSFGSITNNSICEIRNFAEKNEIGEENYKILVDLWKESNRNNFQIELLKL